MDVSLATLKFRGKKINANTIDSDENVDRLLATASAIMSNPDAVLADAVVADEALV